MFDNYASFRSVLDNRSYTVKEAVEYYLNNIEKGKHLNAFLSVYGDEALERAAEIDKKIKARQAGKLAGMVIAVKDVLSLKDKIMTCASKILRNFTPLYTCTAVRKLLDEDAVIIGKTNCDEFAMGSSNENSAYGVVKNPNDPSRVPGGSSGGSAVAVAANMCLAALGTDTGGSTRLPAAFCGVVGFKPTYGRISRYGLTAFASSFDTIGTFTNNLTDAALILKVISGWDKMDSTSVKNPVPNFEEKLRSKITPSDIKIGIVDEFIGEGLQKEIRDTLLSLIQSLKARGFNITSVELPHAKYSIQTYYILTTAEASSNLARYDGARYGYRFARSEATRQSQTQNPSSSSSKSSSSLEDMYVNSRTEGLGTEVKRRIMLGTYVLSAGYYEAYYKKAQKVRRLIRQDFENAFEKVDLILAPSSPTTAFKIGEKIEDPLAMYLNDIYTTISNLAGIPSVSIPLGKDDNKLPIGIQLMGKNFDELSIMQFAHYLMNL